MKPIPLFLTLSCCVLCQINAAAEEDKPVVEPAAWMEARLPLPEISKWLANAGAPAQPAKPAPSPVAAAVLAARVQLAWPEAGPVATMELDLENFSDDWQVVPVFGKPVTLVGVEPAGARLVMHAGKPSVLLAKGTRQTIKVQCMLEGDVAGYVLDLPECASISLTSTGLPADGVVGVSAGGRDLLVKPAGVVGLPGGAGSVLVKHYSAAEVARLDAVPEPSDWEWQNEVVVVPGNGELVCTAFSRIAANNGAGTEAEMSLPVDARSLKIEGEDIAGPVRITRDDDGRQRVRMQWKSRDMLDRQFVVSYTVPVGPLDTVWNIPAPGGTGDQPPRSQFFLAEASGFSYQADGLSAMVVPESLPARIAGRLGGRACRFVGGGASLKLGLAPQRLAATSEMIIHEATWQSRLEPDGAMLHEGSLLVDHRGAATATLEIPENGQLLSCTVAGVAVKPRVEGASRLAIPLPPGTEMARTTLAIAFTTRGAAVHPVEGTMPLALPNSPDFIRTLRWSIVLPPGYQAETHGNMQREDSRGGESRNTLRLAKNLCRDERPAITVFYQRANLAN